MEIDRIIEGCRKQDRSAQRELYERYKRPLFAICLKYCTNRAEAEDNLHDTFIEIFSKINTYKATGSFEGWAKRITLNKSVAKFKSALHNKSVDGFIYPVLDEDIEIATEGLSLDFLLKLIQELPNQYRLVFNLYELDGYSHKEIAEMLSISEGTSKSNLHKAKAILKHKINGTPAIRYKNGN